MIVLSFVAFVALFLVGLTLLERVMSNNGFSDYFARRLGEMIGLRTDHSNNYWAACLIVIALVLTGQTVKAVFDQNALEEAVSYGYISVSDKAPSVSDKAPSMASKLAGKFLAIPGMAHVISQGQAAPKALPVIPPNKAKMKISGTAVTIWFWLTVCAWLIAIPYTIMAGREEAESGWDAIANFLTRIFRRRGGQQGAAQPQADGGLREIGREAMMGVAGGTAGDIISRWFRRA